MQQWNDLGYPKVKGYNGPSWSRKILSRIFTHWNTLWDDRKEMCHGKDSTTRAKAANEQAILMDHTVLQHDAQFFYDYLDKHKSKPTSAIQHIKH